jgi:hypothetical protein
MTICQAYFLSLNAIFYFALTYPAGINWLKLYKFKF